jgi:hypothetical protein
VLGGGIIFAAAAVARGWFGFTSMCLD